MTTTDEDTMHKLAKSTAKRIADEAASVQTLQVFGDELALDDLNEHEQAEVDAARDCLGLDPIEPDEPVTTGLQEWLDESCYERPLSISRHGVNHGDGWTVNYVQIVLGAGGPHVEIRYYGDRAEVVAYGWLGADEARVDVDAEDVQLLHGVDHLMDGVL